MPKSTESTALFMWGQHLSNLTEIIESQTKYPEIQQFFIQPYSDDRIILLAKSTPSHEHPITLYASLTDSVNDVSYRANIVGWWDKRELAKDKELLEQFNKQIDTFQPFEKEVYPESSPGKPCRNLIAVTNVERLVSPFTTSLLIKTSDGKPIKPRTRSGRWCEVVKVPDYFGMTAPIAQGEVEAELQAGIANSSKDTSAARKKRLEVAPKIPEPIQVISIAYKRNADVIQEVLNRANGECEECKKPAPFIRASNGKPFLEVHHVIMLSKGGEDTVDNALAVCPNCHRELHFG